MSQVIVYTDPHIGVQRRSNTTNASQIRLQEENLKVLDAILSMDGSKICAGDLFDTFSNNESTIAAGMRAMRQTDWCLAGNHDSIQAAEKVGSMQLIQASDPQLADRILYAEFGEWGFDTRDQPEANVKFWGVPHVCRQDLFEQSLDAATKDANVSRRDNVMDDYGRTKVLLLHANYNLPWELTETSLNLTRERAEELLATFDYIVTGHDHNPKEDLDGRMIVLGNPMPTAFGEISDKRVLVFEDGVPRFVPVWSAGTGFAEFDASTVPETSDAQFIRVNGTVPAAELAAVSAKVTKLWRECPNLLALKLDVKSEQAAATQSDTASIDRLPDRIEAELKDQGLRDLWQEMLSAERGAA